MHNLKRIISLGSVLLISALSAQAWALPEDREQPIRIQSDSADIDEQSGVAIYSGDVIMTQGSTQLSGDKITIFSTDQGVSKVIAIGQPAHYRERPAEDKELIRAYGNTINYLSHDNRVELIKAAKLYQNGSTFFGEKINYDMMTQVVSAQGDQKPGAKQRVEMVIQPKRKQQSE